MSAAARTLNQHRLHSLTPVLAKTGQRLMNIALIISLLVSAFAVIYLKDVNRRLFIDCQCLQNTHDRLYEEWGKLLLEQSTWSTQARIQKIALQRLEMNLPSSKEVVVLRLHN